MDLLEFMLATWFYIGLLVSLFSLAMIKFTEGEVIVSDIAWCVGFGIGSYITVLLFVLICILDKYFGDKKLF